ncbi:RHS repeat-associated core domain-containing protein [Treponema sp. Marseille-Q3903]|uniref:RHS repeat-associated core domain-containing protein n=1 Tax=Treponema sp. Marseille-Q3903 TaxID=2766703 RepID=UPI001652131D|nr:RHS repeat-associated core domain-containing protein [Treponema sp. Marseille-Q3903]MBC6713237.1 hypothetical protein [Treponema sp. Marseille-Q3903]
MKKIRGILFIILLSFLSVNVLYAKKNKPSNNNESSSNSKTSGSGKAKDNYNKSTQNSGNATSTANGAKSAAVEAKKALEKKDKAAARVKLAKAKEEASKARNDLAKAKAEEKRAKLQAAKERAAMARANSKDIEAVNKELYEAEVEATQALRDAEDASIDAARAIREVEESLDEFGELKAAAEDAQNAADEVEKASNELRNMENKVLNEEENRLKEVYDNMLKIKTVLGPDERKAFSDWYNRQKENLKTKVKDDPRVKEKYRELEKKCDYAKTMYKNLGDTYRKYNMVGDPVNIADGSYSWSNDDFTATCYQSSFLIKRSFCENKSVESFGKGWTCPFDSRIVRCVFDDYDKDIKNAEEKIALAARMKAICDKYNRDFPNYPDDILISYEIKAKNIGAVFEGVKQYCVQRNNLRNFLIDKNKYVTYGRFSNPESYSGFENNLKLLDEDGSEHFFSYDSNGKWKTLSKLSSLNMTLYGLDQNGNIASDDNTDGGYLLKFSDGNKIYYSKYGVLEKKVDRNNNVTQYKNIGGRINEIILANGERISVKRDGSNFITEISSDVYGKSTYSYNANTLKTITDNSGYNFGYQYNQNLNLTKIIRGDGSSISINYEYNPLLLKNVCAAVATDSGLTEKFSLDVAKRQMIHTSYSGKNEISRFNNYGSPVEVIDIYGNRTLFEYNSDNLIMTVSECGVKKHLLYDDKLRLISVCYDGGGATHFKYNDFNQLTQITDSDNFSRTYQYDKKGNLLFEYFNGDKVAEYEYNEKGQKIRERNKNFEIEYEYDRYGNLTKQKNVELNGNRRIFINSYQYDSQNRLIKYSDENGHFVKYQYGENSVTQICDNSRKIERKYDKRKLEKESVIFDLVSGKKYEVRKTYDERNNLVKKYIDGQLSEEYVYDDDNVLVCETKWNIPHKDSPIERFFCKTDYIYDSKGFVKTVKKYDSKTKAEVAYHKKVDERSENTVITQTDPSGFTLKNTFDKFGRIIKEEASDGTVRIIRYSKAGRIKRIDVNDFTSLEYFYNNDGSYYTIKSTKNGKSERCDYDFNDNLISVKDFSGLEFSYQYDSAGDLIYKKTPSYEIKLTRDDYRRVIKEKIESTSFGSESRFSSEIEYVYDDSANAVFEKHGGACCRITRFDGFGNMIERTDEKGHQIFIYNYRGECIENVDGNQNKTIFDYSPEGKICYIKYPDGIEEFPLDNQSKKYDSATRTIEIKDAFGAESKIIFNKDNQISSKTDSKTGTYIYSCSEDKNLYRKTIEIKKENGASRQYNYDFEGNLISERNEVGKVQSYVYDGEHNVVELTNFSGKKDSFKHDFSNNTETFSYSDGNWAKISRNPLGLITKMEGNSFCYRYQYDDYGKLLKFIDDKTDVEVEYKYDVYGRCIEKKSPNFVFIYQYDECGRINKISENISGIGIDIKYDSRSRKTEMVYSNGIETRWKYNKIGLLESCVTKNQIGEILNADFILYDENNRINFVCDKDGNYRKYDYDNDGKLISEKQKLTPDIVEFYKNEAIDCGLYLDSKNTGAAVFNIDYSDYDAINQVMKNAGIENVKVQLNQPVWVQNYQYTSEGNVKSAENIFGKISYEYDIAGRLCLKRCQNTESEGMKFEWDDDNCLTKISNKDKEILFVYNSQKRPVSIIEKDIALNEYKVDEYKYDAFGRRIQHTDSDGVVKNIVYDGFLTCVLECYVLMENGESNIKYAAGNVDYGDDFDNFRRVDDSKYKAFENSKGLHPPVVETYPETYKSFDSSQFDISQNEKKSKTKSAKNDNSYAVLNFACVPLVYINFSSAKNSCDEKEYAVVDFKENCSAFCKNDSFSVDFNVYDAWGNIINNSETASYSLSSSYNSGFCFYDLGYRDYFPQLKCFSSLDPIRAGNNWFAFCAGDPVNYFDVQGFDINNVAQNHTMQDYNDINLGNSHEEKIAKYGCYLISLADIIAQMNKDLGLDNEHKNKYEDPLIANSDSDLFSANSGDLKGDHAMDKLFGEGNWKTYNGENSTTCERDLALYMANVLPRNYYAVGVFDLSEACPKAVNHMVVLNGLPDENGYFDESSITVSSENDTKRLNDDQKKLAYRSGNLKEVRLISDSHDFCKK